MWFRILHSALHRAKAFFSVVREMWTVSETRLISVKETVLTNAERCISA